jgi:hypothetical protein
MARKSKAPKVNPERAARLVALGNAIAEKRAYLETFQGKRLVVSYNDETGWAMTNNTGAYLYGASFMVCLEAIKIAAAPVYTDRPVVKRWTYTIDGRTCEATETTTERVWNW